MKVLEKKILKKRLLLLAIVFLTGACLVIFMMVRAWRTNQAQVRENARMNAMTYAERMIEELSRGTSVSDTLKEVPADQVILGMPFYTRVWEIPSESSSDDTAAGAKIPSKIYGMKAANDFLATHGATKTWQDDCGQNYSEFTDNDTTYKVWLEDSASAECRLKLVEEKKLAGASFWKLGFETSDIWDTVTRYIH